MKLPAYQELSKEQDAITQLPLDGRHLVIGPPGSGKTVMALYRAAMLKRRQRRADLIMYSRLLTQYTTSAVDELLIDGLVKTFHSWFFRFYLKKYHKAPPQLQKYVYDFAAVLSAVAEDPPSGDQMADLIVDEGQDLPKEFYAMTRQVARNVTVFADENQRISETNSTVNDIKIFGALGGPHLLTRNYRNTREIAELAAAFYTGLPSGIAELPIRRGEKPIMRRFNSLKDAVGSIRIYERNNPDRSIGVFTPRTKLQTKIVDALGDDTVNEVQFYEGGQGAKAVPLLFDDPGIIVVNYPSAKGLEFDAVFIPEIQEFQGDLASPDTQMLLYVLTSRARETLQISYSGNGEPSVLRIFPRALLEWK